MIAISKIGQLRFVSTGVIVVAGCGLMGWVAAPRVTAPVVHAQAVPPPPPGPAPGPQGRQFGWDQLTAILSPDGTQPGAQPTWETWSSKCNLAPDIAKAHPDWRMSLTGNCSALYKAPVGRVRGKNPTLKSVLQTVALTPQTSGDLFRPASVFFNSVAVASINNNNWNLPPDGSSAADPLMPGAAIPAQVAFQPGSMIVKATWEVVNLEGSSWPLRVYDNASPQWNQSTGITPPQSLDRVEGTTPDSGWSTQVKLNVDPHARCPYKGGQPASDVGLGSTVPISCFIAHRITRNMYDATLLGNGAGVFQGTYPFYLVLVGLNVATRDDQRWTFTTFWWTNHPSADPVHTSLPPGGLPFRYTQFAMDTEAAGYPVRNPYLEGPEGTTGMSSGCGLCHRLAEVRIDPANLKVIPTQSNLGLPDPTGVPVPLPAGYDQNRTLTDRVWTLADARDGGGPDLTPAPDIKTLQPAASGRKKAAAAK